MVKYIIALFVTFAMLTGCNQQSRQTSGKVASEPDVKFNISEVWRTDTLLRTPESVIYDKKKDLLYVTNVNMEPRKKDGNGFVSKVSTDGKILNLKWIEGLNAPKGTAVVGDTLYVADIDELIVINTVSGKIARKVTVPGIGMINDITSDSEGNLYVSDTDANKIYRYSNGKLSEWLTEGLNLPNGLLAEKERLLLASMGSSDLVAIDITDKSRTTLADSLNRADGIAFFGLKDHYIVTDWSGEVFMVFPGRMRSSMLNTKDIQMNTADCEFLSDKKLLLVPTFFRNCIIAYKLTEENE